MWIKKQNNENSLWRVAFVCWYIYYMCSWFIYNKIIYCNSYLVESREEEKMLCLHQQLIKCFTAKKGCTVFLFKNKHLHVLIILLCLQVMKKLQKCVPCSQVCNQNNNLF